MKKQTKKSTKKPTKKQPKKDKPKYKVHENKTGDDGEVISYVAN